MDKIRKIAKDICTLTGLPVVYYVKKKIEFNYDIAMNADFSNHLVNHIIYDTKENTELDGLLAITIFENNHYKFINIERPYHYIIGPFFTSLSDKNKTINEYSKDKELAKYVSELEKLKIISSKYLIAADSLLQSLTQSNDKNDDKTYSVVTDDNLASISDALLFNRMEVERIELGYRSEKRIRQCIINGDKKQLLYLLSCLEQTPPNDEDRPLSSLREQKNYLLNLNTICRLSAQQTDLSVLTIHTISHEYGRMIEKAKTTEDLHEIRIKMVCEYCDAVKDKSIKGNSYAIVKVRKYILKNIGSDLSLEKLSEISGLKTAYLSRLFKEECNITISDFIKKQRIEEAKYMLENSQMPIVEISESLGFESHSYFSSVFKNAVGISPTAYRMRYCAT